MPRLACEIQHWKGDSRRLAGLAAKAMPARSGAQAPSDDGEIGAREGQVRLEECELNRRPGAGPVGVVIESAGAGFVDDAVVRVGRLGAGHEGARGEAAQGEAAEYGLRELDAVGSGGESIDVGRLLGIISA